MCVGGVCGGVECVGRVCMCGCLFTQCTIITLIKNIVNLFSVNSYEQLFHCQCQQTNLPCFTHCFTLAL